MMDDLQPPRRQSRLGLMRRVLDPVDRLPRQPRLFGDDADPRLLREQVSDGRVLAAPSVIKAR